MPLRARWRAVCIEHRLCGLHRRERATPYRSCSTSAARPARAGNLTRAYRDVLLTLATFRGAGGLICPAHATLAERGGCSVSTVRRALAQAFRLDLVSWTERRIRAGWRWLRTFNAYRPHMVPFCGTVWRLC